MTTLINSLIFILLMALTVITPLIFSTQTTELYEVPKMLFVYLIAAALLTLTLVKSVLTDKISYPKNLIFFSLLILLFVQIVSTFFSIDKFTSIFGFPSRLNGGLLSTIAYVAIAFAALVNLTAPAAKKLLTAMVLTAFAVSLWGIPGHFGKDPSCLVLTGQLSSACWQQEFDPRLRIFSTMGQPNWLASYLVLTLPVSLGLMLLAHHPGLKILFLIISQTTFLALLMTNSRAGAAGVLASLIIFSLLLGFKTLKTRLRILTVCAAGFLLSFLFFGTALTERISEALNPVASSPQKQIADESSTTTTEPTPTVGGTESGQIRLIVWLGALDVFQNYPLWGSGPETFAYSYYQFRPLAHNQTTEWNFFYNKAHNEFLSYLANSGILGFLTYLIFLLATIFGLFKITGISQTSTISKAALAAILGYLLTIFFGFSTVATQVTLFLIIVSVLSLAGRTQLTEAKLNLNLPQKSLLALLIIIFGVYLLTFVIRLALADLLYARAKSYDATSPQATHLFTSAIDIFPTSNPFLLADSAYNSALLATTVENPEPSRRVDDPTASTLINQAHTAADKAFKSSANNVLVARKVANAYLLLSTIDQMYQKNALEVASTLPKLAPTDPQSYLTLAKIQAGISQENEARESLQKALVLKPDYLEARKLLEELD